MRPLFLILAATALALTLAGAACVQMRVVRHEFSSIPPLPGTVDISSPASLAPVLETLSAPHAILVLDVSSSMKGSDPEHVEAEAAGQFYDVYSRLSRAILDKDDVPRIAVVLFATIPQTIDWSGSGEPWLEVSTTNRERFASVIDHYLGGAKGEPRVGQDTDYLAALLETKRLTEHLKTPPAILFLTDGVDEPNPLLSPAWDESRRTELAKKHGVDPRAVQQAGQGRHRYLSAIDLPPIFDARSASLQTPRSTWQPSLQQVRDDGRVQIRTQLNELLGRGFWLSEAQPSVPPHWAPVFLGTAGVEVATSVLTASSSTPAPWERQGVRQSSTANDLVHNFVGVLASWFRLEEQSLLSETPSFTVATDTQAFALELELRRPVSTCAIGSNGNGVPHPLSGNGRFWAGVFDGGGVWRVGEECGAVARGGVFVKPLYEWVLHVPNAIGVRSGKDSLTAEVFLFSLEKRSSAERAPVIAERLFRSLPQTLPGTITFQPGGATVPIELKRNAASENDRVAYRVSTPLGDVSTGSADVRVELGPLARSNIPTHVATLSRAVRLHPSVVPHLYDARGRETAIDVRHVPSAGARIRRWW